MVRVGYQTGYSPKDCKGFDLEVGSSRLDVGLVESNVRIVLLIDVEVFYESLMEKVIESHLFLLQHLRVIVKDEGVCVGRYKKILQRGVLL